MSYLFHLLLTQPIFNALVALYSYITFEDLGLAIILLTIILRFILYPLFYKALRSQSIMQKIQPEIAKIQKEFKADKEQQAQKMMALWKQHKVNPFASFGLIFVQLPILIAVYRVFMKGFSTEAFTDLYSFISAPDQINSVSLGLINVTEPNMIIVVLAVVATYLQSKLALPKIKEGESPSKAQQTSRKMVFLAPVLTLLILPKLSAAIGLYWLTTSLFSIVQQKIVNKRIHTSA
ncbi:MAG: YidC/Oxa1 family membrane protein insertase [bacterium]|nr:YidC/Oxa1 family membrane protein insertase [bacterium]